MRLREANACVLRWHRHHKPVPGQAFAVGVRDDDGLHGVAIAPRPIRSADWRGPDGRQMEVGWMTTIAWDGKTLAADRQGAIGDWKFDDGPKIHRLSGGRYFAAAGQCAIGQRVRHWVDTGLDKPVLEEGDQFSGILVTSDGDAYLLEYALLPTHIQPPFAIGSGAQFALGAMAAGVDAVQAIEIANGLCLHSGFGVNWVTFEGGRARPGCVLRRP